MLSGRVGRSLSLDLFCDRQYLLNRFLSQSSKGAKSNRNGDHTQRISWYPGHIAKAERELADYIKLVDVVIEVRDARILSSTTHPLISKWVGNRPVIVVVSRVDQATKRSLVDWRAHFRRTPPYQTSKFYFIDGNRGDGVDRMRKQILRAGVAINSKRHKLGMEPRPVRAAVIGYPNVGKSSLINRILNRKLAPVQNIAGYTKSIRWVRVSDKDNLSAKNVIELLDSPGIIPARMNDQTQAMALAICNDIGEASYDKCKAAVALCDRVIALNKYRKGYVSIPSISLRYNISFDGDLSGEEILSLYAERLFHSQELPAAEKILADFRRGYWGLATLEYPPDIEEIDREMKTNPTLFQSKEVERQDLDEQEQRSKIKVPVQSQGHDKERSSAPITRPQSGRIVVGASDSGIYDGW